jgi:mannose-6-phosphate isomerase-like protein (cupin superfamily)
VDAEVADGARDREEIAMSPLIDVKDSPHGENAHTFVGADHGELPVSLILVHSVPGAGPDLHRHPYPEVFVVESGRATFEVDGAEIVAEGGQIVVAPADSPHGFTNTGSGELRLTAIHASPEMITEWLEHPDPSWASRRSQ